MTVSHKVCVSLRFCCGIPCFTMHNVHLPSQLCDTKVGLSVFKS